MKKLNEYLLISLKLFLISSCSLDEVNSKKTKNDTNAFTQADKSWTASLNDTGSLHLIGKVVPDFSDSTLLKTVFGSYISTRHKYFYDYSEILDSSVIVHRYTYGESYDPDTVDVVVTGKFDINDTCKLVFFAGEVTVQHDHQIMEVSAISCRKRGGKWKIKECYLKEFAPDQSNPVFAGRANGYLLLKDSISASYGGGFREESVRFMAYGPSSSLNNPIALVFILINDGPGLYESDYESTEGTYSFQFINELNSFKFNSSVKTIDFPETQNKQKARTVITEETNYMNEKTTVRSRLRIDSMGIKKIKVELSKKEIQEQLKNSTIK